MKLYVRLESLLDEIEKKLKESPTINELAESFHLSVVHLQRLFKDAFGVTLASYMRSRKLADSLDLVVNSHFGIVDIALEYGFEHAQSYTRAFKAEFGLTPGQLRQSGQLVKIKPPLQLLPINDVADGLLFGPEIVYLSEFSCIGRCYIIPEDAPFTYPAEVARDFWLKDKERIINPTDENSYIGLTTFSYATPDYTVYTPSVIVGNDHEPVAGYEKNQIPAGTYVRFHYIGMCHPLELDAEVAEEMYDAIEKFQQDAQGRYGLYHKSVNSRTLENGMYFEKVSPTDYDGTYCKMEWYSPIYEK